ncbi:MAG: hypothetical protein AAFO58_12805 [Pseudomonadota bacterium]
MFKKFAIAATAIALTATAASANSFFGQQDGFDEGASVVELDLIRADSAGFVSIETLQGEVLGMASVNAGANADVRVPLMGTGLDNDVVAKLVIDGQVADTKRIEVR